MEKLIICYGQQFFVGVCYAVVHARIWVENVPTMFGGFHDGACVVTPPHFTRSWVYSVEQGSHWSGTGGWIDDVFLITSVITSRQNGNICIKSIHGEKCNYYNSLLGFLWTLILSGYFILSIQSWVYFKLSKVPRSLSEFFSVIFFILNYTKTAFYLLLNPAERNLQTVN